MKVFSLAIVLVPPNKSAGRTILSSASDVFSFALYRRSSIGEFMSFFTKTVAERTSQGQRQSTQQDTHTAHVYNRGGTEQLAAVMITDQEYPVRPAFSLLTLTKLLDDFIVKVPQASFDTPAVISFPEVNICLQKYQDPRQADPIIKVQQELDETKIILHKTIQSVLQRGENIDDLVISSSTLSAQNKLFYKTAKQQNSCCVIM